LKELNLDLSKYEKVESPHPENWFYYANSEEGVVIRTEVRDDREEVISIIYEPTNRDAVLLCTNRRKQNAGL
jgi:hypothetical protein